MKTIIAILLTLIFIACQPAYNYLEMENCEPFEYHVIEYWLDSEWGLIDEQMRQDVIGLDGLDIMYRAYRSAKNSSAIIMVFGEARYGNIYRYQRIAIQNGYELVSVLDRYKDTDTWYQWDVDTFCEQNPDCGQCPTVMMQNDLEKYQQEQGEITAIRLVFPDGSTIKL